MRLVGQALRKMCAHRQWHLPIVCARGLFLGALDIADLSLWLRDRLTLMSVEAALISPRRQSGGAGELAPVAVRPSSPRSVRAKRQPLVELRPLGGRQRLLAVVENAA